MKTAVHLAQTERSTIVMIDVVPQFARAGQFDGTAVLAPDDSFIAAEGEALALSRALRMAAEYYDGQYRRLEALKKAKPRKQSKAYGSLWPKLTTPTQRD